MAKKHDAPEVEEIDPRVETLANADLEADVTDQKPVDASAEASLEDGGEVEVIKGEEPPVELVVNEGKVVIPAQGRKELRLKALCKEANCTWRHIGPYNNVEIEISGDRAFEVAASMLHGTPLA